MSYFDPTLIMFMVYIVAMVLIGLFAYRATSDFSDYILGGRSLGSFVTALSAGASDMSGWLLMGLPGAIYLSGLSEAWIAIGLIIGAWLNWLLVAGRLRVHTEIQNNALTLPDYFTSRFDDQKKILRIFSAVIILVFFAIYCASGMVAGARLFENLFGMSYTTAIWLSAIATISYVCIGGFLAISWTDTFQAGLMIFALLLTPIVTYLAIGDTTQFVTLIETARPHAFNIISDLSVVAVLSSMAWGLGYFGQPHILARFMAAYSVKSLIKARRISMTWMVICLAGAIGIGFFGIPYFFVNPNVAGVVNNEPEQVFIELAKLLFNPWIAGILLSAILAAVMSTLSAQLLISSSSITEDFYKGFIRPKAAEKELVWLGRAMVLVIAAIAIWIAQDENSKVLKLVEFAWAGFGSAFGPVVLFSLFWKRMTSSAALIGMIVGATVVFAWRSVIPKTSEWFNVYEMIPGFTLASLAIIVVSLLSAEPENEVKETFEKAEKAYKEAK